MTEYSIPNVRNALVEYFREKADYRSRLAEEKDPSHWAKNTSYAGSLELVATYVAALPDDNATLQQLANCTYLFSPGGDVFCAPRTDECGASLTDNEAIHCGPRGSVMDPAECAEWFESWTKIVLDEYPEYLEWMSEMTGCDFS
jgi:hypothetical protein